MIQMQQVFFSNLMASHKTRVLRILERKSKMFKFLNDARQCLVLLNTDPDLEFSMIQQFLKTLCPNLQKKPNLDQNDEISLFSDFENSLRVIVIGIGWLKQIWSSNIPYDQSEEIAVNNKKKTEYAIKIIHLYLLNQMLRNIPNKSFYLTLEWRLKTFERTVSEFKGILGENNLGVISFNYRGDPRDNSPRSIYLNNNKKENQILIKAMLEEEFGRLDNLFKFDYLGKKKKDLMSELQNRKSDVEKYILSVLDAPQTIIRQVLGSRNYQIKNCFEKFEQELDAFQSFQYDLVRPFKSNIQSSILTQKITESKIRILFFIKEFLDIYTYFANKSPLQRNVEEFIRVLLQAYRKVDNKGIDRIEKVIVLMLDLISQLSYFNEQGFLNMNIVAKCKDWIPEPQKILDQVFMIPIQKCYDELYYEQLLNLTSMKLQKKDSLFELIEKLKLFHFKVDIYKNKMMFEKFLRRNNAKSVEAIKNLCNMFKDLAKVRQNMKNKKLFEEIQISEIETLSLIAQCLKQIQRFDLALQIYKIIKFPYKIQDCFHHIFIFTTNQSEQVELMIDLSQYFQAIGERQLSQKYACMAYEANPSKLGYLITLKKCNRSEQEQNTLNPEDYQQNPQRYFYGELNQEFWQQIEQLTGLIPQQNNFKVSIKKKKLDSILNRVL